MESHSLKETSRVFRVGKNAIIEWIKKYRETGDLSNKHLNRRFKKIDPEKLKAHKGKPVFGKISGRKFKRTSIVATKLGKILVSPMQSLQK